MWQVLLAAAVAGSGFYAKRFLNINGDDQISAMSLNPSGKNDEELHSAAADSSHSCDTKRERTSSRLDDDESSFRFSSASGSLGRPGEKTGSSKLRKKLGSLANVERKGGVANTGAKLGDDHDQRKNGKKFAVCLKKRRTGRNSSAKSESSSSKDGPSFGWGVGVGMMYMMSAGKAEIGRLNTVMDETVKVVRELKTEIAKRKSNHTNQNTSNQPVKLKNEISDDVKCPSDVITKEPQLAELEIDRLEAELEYELQKLPFCSGEVKTPYYSKTGAFDDQFGVKSTELDQKLCHLLIEQQEEQIVELESQLQMTNSKLNEKEAQLQSLKDCVSRLTHISLGNAERSATKIDGVASIFKTYSEFCADDETDSQLEEKIIETESNKSTAGIKRTIDFESYS